MTDPTFECKALRPFWPMYLDGELQTEDARPYLEHLEACPACRGFVEGEQRFRQVFRHKVSGREMAPPHLREKVAAMTRPRSAMTRYRFALATGAMGLLVVVTFTTQSGFSPILQEVADKHRAELPMDVTTSDLGEAQRFVDRHVPRVHIPTLNVADAKLTGARVVDLPGKHRGIIVRYLVGPNARPVSVVVYAKNLAEDVQLPNQVNAGRHQVSLSQVDNLHAAVWDSENSIYSMVGEMDEGQLLHLVSAAQ